MAWAELLAFLPLSLMGLTCLQMLRNAIFYLRLQSKLCFLSALTSHMKIIVT
jgi:hypothetical protein